MRSVDESVSPYYVRMTVEELVSRLGGDDVDTRDVVLPDGVKAVLGFGSVTVYVVQVPPRLHRLSWITDDSPADHPGDSPEGVRYEEVTLALPYVVVLAAFQRARNGEWYLSDANECFFRNDCLKSLDDRLCYPALLNVSKFSPSDGKPLAWLCTQYLDRRKLRRERNENRRARGSIEALLQTLFGTGFNRSSERHEMASWFGESRKVDPRISTVQCWQEASRDDPLFVLDVPWLDTGKTVRQVAARMAGNLGAAGARVKSAEDVARQMFHHGAVQNVLF